MGFAPEYSALVLAENFEDAKRLFYEPLMAIHHAHLVMLARQGIVGEAEARALRDGLAGIDGGAVLAASYDGRVEDLFCYVNELLVAAVGVDVAGRLHTARSRNDIDMTMYRMRQRKYLLELYQANCRTRPRVVVPGGARGGATGGRRDDRRKARGGVAL